MFAAACVAGSSFPSTIMHSLVIMSDDTLAASTRAVQTTFSGSMTPAAIMPVLARGGSYPQFSSLDAKTFSTTTEPSTPAFAAIVRTGTFSAPDDLDTDLLVEVAHGRLEIVEGFVAVSRAVPPPATMPSSTAAFVAFRASTTRSFFSPPPPRTRLRF